MTGKTRTGATELYRDFYEHEAEQYRITREAEPAWVHRRNLVRRLLPRRVEGPVLDAGSGDGAMSDDLARTLDVPVIGVELALRRARFAREHHGRASFLLGSIYELPFPDGSFSLVVCADLLEHLDDPGRAVAELVRVSSGHVIVTVPYCIDIETTLCPHCLREYYLYGHQHSFGREGIREMTRACGAGVERFEHLVPMFECRRYRWFPPLKWLVWSHFKDSGTLGARLAKGSAAG